MTREREEEDPLIERSSLEWMESEEESGFGEGEGVRELSPLSLWYRLIGLSHAKPRISRGLWGCGSHDRVYDITYKLHCIRSMNTVVI